MPAPNWATGMRMLGPGIYRDAANGLHFDLPGICRVLGVPPTPGNQEIAEQAAREAVRDTFGAAKIPWHEVQEDQP